MDSGGSFSLLEQVFGGDMPFQIDLGGVTTISGVLGIIAHIVLILAIGISFVYMAYSFVSIAGSWGDEKLFKKSMDSLLWSIGSFIIAVLAYVIVHAIYGIL